MLKKGWLGWIWWSECPGGNGGYRGFVVRVVLVIWVFGVVWVVWVVGMVRVVWSGWFGWSRWSGWYRTYGPLTTRTTTIHEFPVNRLYECIPVKTWSPVLRWFLVVSTTLVDILAYFFSLLTVQTKKKISNATPRFFRSTYSSEYL